MITASQVLANQDLYRILIFTDTEAKPAKSIASTLDIPIATVHRDLKKLSKEGLLLRKGKIRGRGRHKSQTYLSNVLLIEAHFDGRMLSEKIVKRERQKK